MKSVIKAVKTWSALIYVGASLFLAIAVAGTAWWSNFATAINPPTSRSEHLLTIYDRGQETLALTNVATVGEALAEAGIELDGKDVVEPARGEELIASEYSINIYRARPVVVVDGATRQKVVTPYQTSAQIAKDAGIKVYPEDIASLVRSNDLLSDGAGLVMEIDRATAFSFNLYGKKTLARTQGVTVADMLAEKGIVLGDKDKVAPSLNKIIESGDSVRVWREGKQLVTVEEKVDFKTEFIYSGDLPIGYSEVVTPGVLGARNVTYKVVFENGKEVSRQEVASITTKQSSSQVEVVGVKVLSSLDYSKDRVAIMKAGGVPTKDHSYAAYIIDNENTLWCPIRWQGTAGCAEIYYEKFPGAETSSQVGYGLCQATPAIKMESAGSDWRTNVVTQMKWCNSYALGRYGSWQAAYQFKLENGWW